MVILYRREVVRVTGFCNRENNLYDQISRTKITTLRDGYDRAILKMKNDRERLESQNNKFSQDKKQLENQNEDLKNRSNNIGNFHTLLSSLTDENDQITLRIKMNIEIRKLFEWIRIYPIQEQIKKYTVKVPHKVREIESKYFDMVICKLRDLPSKDVFVRYYATNQARANKVIAEEYKNMPNNKA